MNSQQIINDVKVNFRELNYNLTLQDDIPVKLVGTYENSPVFVINFSDATIDFEDLYNNDAYKKQIRPIVNESEKFLIESSGVSFYYTMHRSMIEKLIPKIIIALKNYYISHRKETIEHDFSCRR